MMTWQTWWRDERSLRPSFLGSPFMFTIRVALALETHRSEVGLQRMTGVLGACWIVTLITKSLVNLVNDNHLTLIRLEQMDMFR